MRTQGGQCGRRGGSLGTLEGTRMRTVTGEPEEVNPETREGTGLWKGICGLRVLGYWNLSTHWLGLAPKASRRRTVEVWPSSADRKSPVCPAEFSPSTWTTEGQQSLNLCSLQTPGSLSGHQATHIS